MRAAIDGLQVAMQARWPLYFWFAHSNILSVRSAVFNAEAHIPTQPSSPLKDARISFSHEDQERAGGAVAPARQGAQARLREGWPPRVNHPPRRTEFCVVAAFPEGSLEPPQDLAAVEGKPT